MFKGYYLRYTLRRSKRMCLLFICILLSFLIVGLLYYNNYGSHLRHFLAKQRNRRLFYTDENIIHNWILTNSLQTHFIGESTFHLTRCGRRNNKEVDVLCMKPPSFLRNYKNPCWMHEKMLRCYPYFQLIGMDKSGSSDLFSRLVKHPDIYGNDGELGKETQWWPWKKYGIFMMRRIEQQSFDDYLEYFENATKSIISKVDTYGYHVGITGDGTPMDSWDFSGWPQIPQNQGLKEPMFTTPDLIKHINPDVKLIMIMRNPIDRLYSDYFFLGLGGTSPKDFHDAVVSSIAYLKDCMVHRSLRMCLYDRQMHLKWNQQARIHLGFYYVFVSEWLAVFPRRQFLFLKTEEYSRNISETVRRTFDFLEVEPLNLQDYTRYGINEQERRHTTKYKPPEPMLDVTRRILHDLYQPFNDKLADLLNDATFSWNDS